MFNKKIILKSVCKGFSFVLYTYESVGLVDTRGRCVLGF